MSARTNSRSGRVAGKLALVTGAGSGIGAATAKLLASEGAEVACADRNEAGVAEVVEAIVAAGNKAWPVLLDVTSEIQWQRVMNEIDHRAGRLDIVVQSAGISLGGSIVDLTLEDWHRLMAVNLDGIVLGTKHAVRLMRSRECRGSLVHVASASGVKAVAGAAAYCCSKAAVLMFTRVAALECQQAKDGIRVNAVSPGGVRTPIWKSMPFFEDLIAKEGGEEQAFAAMERMSPQGRFAWPEEIAQGILYLASDESAQITGTNLVIDNGYTA